MSKSFTKPLVLAMAMAFAALMAGGTTQMVGSGQPQRLALVASEADGNVVVLNLHTGQAEKTLPTGKVPHAMAIALGGKIYVNNRGTRELTLLDGKFSYLEAGSL